MRASRSPSGAWENTSRITELAIGSTIIATAMPGDERGRRVTVDWSHWAACASASHVEDRHPAEVLVAANSASLLACGCSRKKPHSP